MNAPLTCEFIVERVLRGRRIETFLAKHLRNWSTWRIQRMIQAGCVTVNENPVGCEYRVHQNEVVRIRVASPPDRSVVPQDMPLEVLYEDPWLIVVNKPSGQIAHPGGDFLGRTLVNAIQHHVDQQTRLPGLIRPGIVHRIDRKTTGVMVVPKEHLAHSSLTRQFEERLVSKSYQAIVRGKLPEDHGVIDLPIGNVPNETCTLMCCKSVAENPKSARTDYRVLERFENYTFIEALPLTGRHHQIRVHFSEFGYPLLADEYYGPDGLFKDGTLTNGPDAPLSSRFPGEPYFEEPTFDQNLPMRRQALHAASISITHPVSEMPMTFEAPLPDDMIRTLTLLRDA